MRAPGDPRIHFGFAERFVGHFVEINWVYGITQPLKESPNDHRDTWVAQCLPEG
jgi:hypothetical protein